MICRNNETQTYIHQTDRNVQTETNVQDQSAQTVTKTFENSTTQYFLELQEDGTQTSSKVLEDKSLQFCEIEQFFNYEDGKLLSLGEKPGERLRYISEGFQKYQIESLFRHNFYRSFHPDTPPMTLKFVSCFFF